MKAKYARRIRIGIVQAKRDREDVKGSRNRPKMREFNFTDDLQWAAWQRTWHRAYAPVQQMPDYGWRVK